MNFNNIPIEVLLSESTVVLSMYGWHRKKMAAHTFQLQVMSSLASQPLRLRRKGLVNCNL